jgi:hypothetical protein
MTPFDIAMIVIAACTALNSGILLIVLWKIIAG